MKLEDQVCSLDLAKKLKELGVKQESYFRWQPAVEINGIVDEWTLDVSRFEPYCAAFTVAELGEMLPNGFSVKKMLGARFGDYYCYAKIGKSAPFLESAHTEADARAKMFIYLIENQLLKVESINQSES